MDITSYLLWSPFPLKIEETSSNIKKIKKYLKIIPSIKQSFGHLFPKEIKSNVICSFAHIQEPHILLFGMRGT